MADEPNFNAAFSFTPQGRGIMGRWGRQRNVTGNVSASMRIEVPGLKEFKAELKAVREMIQGLRTDMERLGPAATSMGRSLAGAAGASASARCASGSGSGAGYAAGKMGYTHQAIDNMASHAGGGLGGGFRFGSNITKMLGGSGGLATGIGLLVGGVTMAANLSSNRFEQVRGTNLSTDAIAARLALSQGSTITGVRQNMLNNPIMGSAQDRYGAMGALNVIGFSSGRRGQIAQSDISMLQTLLPGLNAQEAGTVYAGYYANVEARKRALMYTGRSAFGPGNIQRSLPDQFADILAAMERLAGKKFSREDLTILRTPGSPLWSNLEQTGLPSELIDAWFEWSIAKAQYTANGGTGKFTGSKAQMDAIRGESQAFSAAMTETTSAKRDESLAADLQKQFLRREEVDRQLIGVLKKIDEHFTSLIGQAGNAPTGMGQVGSGAKLGAAVAAGAGIGALIGAPFGGVGAIPGAGVGALVGGGAALIGMLALGDPQTGTSHLSPDLRPRVDAMLKANPGLRINSAYRGPVEQGRLHATGNPNIAPAGKSLHARGRAVDIAGSPEAMAWMQQNAKRFGLETAARLGEPWHIQLAGSMLGDPQSDRAREAYLRDFTLNTTRLMAARGSTGTTGSSGFTAAPTAAPSGGGILNAEDVVRAAYAAGFRGEDLITAVAIANRESGWKTDAYNGDRSTQDDSYGLWQINMLGEMGNKRLAQWGLSSYQDLNDPYVAARAAFSLYQGRGNSFYDWGPYKGMSPTYNVKPEAFDQARSAAKALGYIGDVYSGGGGVVGGGGITFHNTFQINVGGGQSASVGLEEAAKRAAARMEAQVRRTVSRRS